MTDSNTKLLVMIFQPQNACTRRHGAGIVARLGLRPIVGGVGTIVGTKEARVEGFGLGAGGK